MAARANRGKRIMSTSTLAALGKESESAPLCGGCRAFGDRELLTHGEVPGGEVRQRDIAHVVFISINKPLVRPSPHEQLRNDLAGFVW